MCLTGQGHLTGTCGVEKERRQAREDSSESDSGMPSSSRSVGFLKIQKWPFAHSISVHRCTSPRLLSVAGSEKSSQE